MKNDQEIEDITEKSEKLSKKFEESLIKIGKFWQKSKVLFVSRRVAVAIRPNDGKFTSEF